MQIADILRAEIETGQLALGAKLPSTRQLVERFGASHETIRQVISRLKVSGLVVSRQGSGVYVRQLSPIRRLSRSRLSREERTAARGAFLTDAAAANFSPEVEITRWTEAANDKHATALETEAGSELFVRHRVMSADGEPLILSTSRLPRALTRDTPIEDTNPGPGGSYARLEERLETTLSFTEVVTARMPTSDEAKALHLQPGTPVLLVTRTARAAGRPVEVNEMVLVGPRYELVYEIDG